MEKKRNLWVIPTDKPSSIGYDGVKNLHFVNDFIDDYQNIYITSDEEIKEGNWCILLENHYVNGGIGKYNTEKAIGYGLHNTEFFKKIILTTDQDLIKDGVQSIPDDFLEWFVKHPTCEYIEIENVYDKFLNGDKRSVSDFRKKYKIIIPKEEQKQDWYCPKCDSYVSAESVTFEETHQICNTSVIDKEEPKQETLEEITEQIQKDCHKFVESIISKVTYQDATNTFLFMKLAELTLKLKKYE